MFLIILTSSPKTGGVSISICGFVEFHPLQASACFRQLHLKVLFPEAALEALFIILFSCGWDPKVHMTLNLIHTRLWSQQYILDLFYVKLIICMYNHYFPLTFFTFLTEKDNIAKKNPTFSYYIKWQILYKMINFLIMVGVICKIHPINSNRLYVYYPILYNCTMHHTTCIGGTFSTISV